MLLNILKSTGNPLPPSCNIKSSTQNALSAEVGKWGHPDCEVLVEKEGNHEYTMRTSSLFCISCPFSQGPLNSVGYLCPEHKESP